MALKQRQILTGKFTMVAGEALTAGEVCQISSSTLIAGTASTEASSIFVTTEAADSGDAVSCALPGSIVFCTAADANTTEGEWVVASTGGTVTGAGTLSTASQYYVGIALQASSAASQEIAVLYYPGIAPKSAS